MPTIPPISSRGDRYVRSLRHRAGWIVLGALILTVGAVWLAARLDLRTDLAELLPSGDPSVQELRRVQSRLPSFGALIVNISSDQPAANRLLADEVAAAVRQRLGNLAEVALSNLKSERLWFEQHKWLYASKEELAKLHDRLEREIHKRQNPLLIDFEEDDEDGESLEEMRARLEREHPALARLKKDYFTTDDGKTAMVVIFPRGGIFQERAGEALTNGVRAITAELSAKHASRTRFDIGLSGDIESAIEERDALENDLVWATAIAVLLVCLSVGFYYRSLRAIPLMALPALMGTAFAFASAQLLYGFLNSSTAFLGSIIMGNGINFAIIQLARYEEERSLGAVPSVALVRAVAATVRATGIAACAASIAYGSLVLTRFRGFSQFGVIGGLGMIFCWIATMTVLPALLWLLDRKKPAAAHLPRQQPRQPWMRWLALPLDTPKAWTGAFVLLSLLGSLALPAYLADPFEYNFKNLRSAASDSKRGEARWYAANQKVFGQALNPLVLLAESPRDTETIRTALRAADVGAPASGEDGQKDTEMLGSIVTMDDLIPGSAAEQAEKRAVLRQIHALGQTSSFKLLDDSEREEVESFLPPAHLEPIEVASLPPLVLRPFTELDGTRGRVVLMFQRSGAQAWDGRDMLRLSERVASVSLPDGRVVRATGTPIIFAGMIRSILEDGPRATLASAVGVSLLVFALSRGLTGALLVLFTLGTGVLWMLIGAALTSQRVNFLNFVALPITIGIGVDYAINIYLRYRLEGPGRLAAATRTTGGAVALCSVTTIIGYGALLVADNRGLRSFGLLAIMGEVACLVAALFLLTSLLALRERRSRFVGSIESGSSAAQLKATE